MLNEVMKKITKMTKQEFDELVLKHGLTYVRRLLAEKKKNVSISIKEGFVYVTTLKRVNRKRLISSLVKNNKKLKTKDILKQLDVTTEQNRIWFEDLYKQQYSIESDFYNKPSRNRTIPNIVNKDFKYVIYVINPNEPNFSDKIIKYYKKLEYKILTIVSNNTQSYIKLIQDLSLIRENTY